MKKILLAIIIFISALSTSYSQCSKPTVVSITAPSTAAATICEGGVVTFSATVTVSGLSQNGGFTYSWRKTSPAPVTTLIAPTAISIAPNISTNIPSFIINSAVPSDGGTYVLRVEDGNSGNAACYTEASIVLTVNPIPAITSPPTGMACSGVAQNYFITSNVPSTYTWVRAAVVGISNPPATSLSNPITETLTNTTSMPIVVRYFITATSTANCVSPVFYYDVTVNPRPHVNSAATGTICNGVPQNYSITSTPASTYSWTRAVVNGITNLAGSASSNSITETLINITASPVIVRYTITPTSTANCVGTPFNYDVTVHPTLSPSVTINADKSIICSNETTIFTANVINGGAPVYQWSKNAVIIPSATNSIYSTSGSVNGDTYTVQMTSSYPCASPPTAVSNSITITVTPTPTINVTIMPNVTNICSNNLVVFTATVSGTGTTPAPSYEWFVTSSNTPTGGVSQGGPSTTATIFATSALTATNNKVYVNVKSNATCASSTPVASNLSYVTVSSGIGSGTIGPDQTICYNTIPATITQTTAPTNVVGTPTYTWEAAITASGPFSIIPTSNGQNFTPSVPITQDVYIRRVTTDPGAPAPCNVATSNVVHITVRPPLTAGIIGSDQTICAGTTTAIITETTAPVGGITYAYQWESSEDGALFSNIVGATNSNYNAGLLTETTYYRRKENSPCGITYSNAVVKTVSAPEVVTAVIDNTPAEVCAATTLTITATGTTTGTGTLNYQWFLGATPVGTNNSSYSYTSVSGDNGKEVSVVVTTSSGCNTGSATSNPFMLDIVHVTTPTVTISGNPVNCIIFPTNFTATSTGGGFTPTYMWYVVPSGSAFGTPGNPVGTSGTTYNSSTLLNGDRVYVELTSSLNCLIGTNPFKSNEIEMLIKPLPTPSIIEGDQTICAPNSFTFHGNVTAGNMYEWRQLPTNTVVGTGPDYTALQSGTYSIHEDNGTCSATSAIVTLIVDPCGAFSTSISGPNPITPGQQNSVYSVPNQTGFSYRWSITGGTIVSGQNTNAVTVDWDAPSTNAFARTTSTYSISVLETNPSGQTKTTTSTINTISTSVALSQAQSGINVFPNPTTGSFNIEMPESGVGVTYEILDLTGLSVASGTFTSTGGDQKINADFGAGMYQVVLKYNNVVTCIRLSKVQ